MYVCEEFCVSFFLFYLCSVVHYAHDCSCMCMYVRLTLVIVKSSGQISL